MWPKSEPCIKPMRIGCAERPSRHRRQIRMPDCRGNHSLAQPHPPMRRQNIDIRQMRTRRPIRHHPRKPDLFSRSRIDPKT